MRRFKGHIRGLHRRTVARVVGVDQLASCWRGDLNWLVPADSASDVERVARLRASGVNNVFLGAPLDLELTQATKVPLVQSPGTLVTDDVVAIAPELQEVQVLVRALDLHQTVFLTNRCNSRCVMCSQPPTRADDSWLVGEALAIAQHIGHEPAVLGFTGGEPLLLRQELRRVLLAFCGALPATQFHVLTNGRLLSDRAFARDIVGNLPRTTWMIPLYGHADFLHDEVVQAPGAFDETIAGILNLQEAGQPIQLRIVLIEPVLRVLPELCAFVARNLPFVREVALMGCEPIGFALANRPICAVDLRNWQDELVRSVRHLTLCGVPVVLMNLPLCSLPRELWPLASRSISDWKQTYSEECETCAVQDECCGMFSWHKRGWSPSRITPILRTGVTVC